MNPMIKLLASNKARGSFKIEAQADAKEATIYLYDMIVDSDVEAEWWGGVSPQAFIKALGEITAPTIHLRVNSPGGSVFAARAIEQAIREHKSTVVAHVDGLAASAASFLIMAADQIHMAPGSFLMIHKAWTVAWGNSEDLTKTAALLDQIDGSLVKTYAARSGQKPEDIATWMADETWIEADRAVELGFASLVDAGTTASNSAAQPAAWDTSAFKNAPKPEQNPANPAQNRENPPAVNPPPARNTADQPDREALRRQVLKALIPA